MIIFSSCDRSVNSQEKSDFEQLCNIYEEFIQNPEPEENKIEKLTKRIEKELPNIYIHYKNIAIMPRNDKYIYYKKLAEETTNKPWNCTVMKEYFSTDN